jgi:CheY-like chemotaxis protein
LIKKQKKKVHQKNNNSFKTLVNNYKFWNLNIQVAQDSFNKFQTNINENIEKMKNTREKIRTLNDSLKKSISSVKYMDSKYSMNVDDTSTIENILKSNKDKNQNTENIVDNVNNITNLNIVTTATTAAATVATTNELLNNGVTTQNNVALLPSDNNYIPMNTNTILINSNTNPLATTFDPKATMNLNVSSSSTPPIEIKTSPPTRTVSLPLQNSDLRATTSLVKSVKKPKWSQPPRVLLVEDDAICRSVSSKLLQIFGCKFDVAVDGQYAIERMGNKKYDIVLMDIMMPRVDGVTATKSIRQFDQLTPIISMTSNTTENDCITYLSNGMNDVLPKPFNKNGLLTVLERYCSHLRHMNETSIDPGFSKTIMMIGSNDNNVNNSIIGFNWNNNVETSQGRITELHDDDISNATANNSSSSSNSNTITNNNANVSTTSSINVGPVISNVNPVNVTTQVPNTDQVLLSMYNEKGTTSNLDTMTMPNYNNVTLQPQIAIQDTQNVNVQYYSSIPNPTIITSHIQSPPNQLQTTTPQIIPTSTADPTLMQNPILLTTNNIVLPSNQNQSTFIPNDPNSILGKRKADNDLRLINKTIST